MPTRATSSHISKISTVAGRHGEGEKDRTNFEAHTMTEIGRYPCHDSMNFGHPQMTEGRLQRDGCSEVAEMVDFLCKLTRVQVCISMDWLLYRGASLLPLILPNSPGLSRGGLPLSGMVWRRDISCFRCPPMFTQPGVPVVNCRLGSAWKPRLTPVET